MNVTDGDRERAREIVAALSPEGAYVDEFVYDGDVAPLHDAIAAALAEERERARAELQPIVDELRADERDGIPPHVPLLISALESFIAAEETTE